jgi:hypothetical protein
MMKRSFLEIETILFSGGEGGPLALCTNDEKKIMEMVPSNWNDSSLVVVGRGGRGGEGVAFNKVTKGGPFMTTKIVRIGFGLEQAR